MNKKASILDGIFITVIILALFLGFTVAKLTWDKVHEDGKLVGNNSIATTHVERYDSLYLPMFDNFFVFVIFGSYISVFILAYFIRGTPAFLPIMLVIIVIGGVLAVFVSNAHDTIITGSPVIAETVAGWTKMAFLMENLPLISMVYLVGLTVVMLSLGEGM